MRACRRWAALSVVMIVTACQGQADGGSPATSVATDTLAPPTAETTPRSSAAAVASAPSGFTPQPSLVPQTFVLGGAWAGPAEASVVTNALTLGAVPTPGNPNVPVTSVTFTMEWLGFSGTACVASKPASGEVWSCLAHPATVGAPPGPLRLGFDVMDDLGDVARRPDGTRTVTLAPPVAPAGWTTPQLVDSTSCSPTAATIDDLGGYHVAANCDGGVQYSTARPGGAWESVTFPHPSDRLERHPQIAVDGDQIYMAFTWVALLDGGCGDPGIRDVGVYYRQRTLPDGPWSGATRLGSPDDQLQSFRVVDGSIHATVRAADEHVFYERLERATLQRIQVPGVIGGTSLRIGSDGRARIAYETDGGLELATFDGDELSTTPIPGSGGGYNPAMVLGGSNDAHLVWTRAYHGGGCAEPGPFPEDGTYYGTNEGGTWVTGRITPDVGQASITMDAATGRVHVILSGPGGLLHYTKAADGDWEMTSLSTKPVGSPIIRRDPTSGALLVVFVGDVGSRTEGIFAMTKP